MSVNSRTELFSFAYLRTYGALFVSTHKYDKVRVSCRLYLSTVRHSIFDRAPCEDDVPREGAAHIILTSPWAMHTSRPLGMVLEERHHGVGAPRLSAPWTRTSGGVQVRPLNHSRVYFWWSRSVRAGSRGSSKWTPLPTSCARAPAPPARRNRARYASHSECTF